MKINLNTLGLYLMLLLLILIQVHEEIHKLFVYYREIFGLLFIILLIMHGPSKIFKSMINKRIFFEILFLILFPLIIIVTALVDPMVNLYGESLGTATRYDGGGLNPKLYVFRNAVLYLPMVFYFTVRGLSPSDINKIAVVTALFAPFSIIIFLAGISDSSVVADFLKIINGELMDKYNTFVPCFAISVLSILYLMDFHYKKYIFLIKMILMTILAFILVFIFYSTSRQALLLALIYISIFAFKNISISKLMNIIYFAIFCVALYYFYVWITLNYGGNIRLIAKLADTSMHSSRFLLMREGLAMLKLSEFFTGAGLTSVMVSGPHNDYIRWVQRIGLIFMFFSFYPFFSAMFKSFFDFQFNKNDRVHLYILCASLFIIFNSVFGYPREDAYQSILCFMAMSMWLGYNTYNKKNRGLVNQNL